MDNLGELNPLRGIWERIKRIPQQHREILRAPINPEDKTFLDEHNILPGQQPEEPTNISKIPKPFDPDYYKALDIQGENPSTGLVIHPLPVKQIPRE